MNVISAIPFWNSSIFPVLSIASGLWLGTQLGSVMSTEVRSGVESMARWIFFAYAVMALFYFWNARHGSPAVRASLTVVLKGGLCPLFYVGFLLLGLALPLALTLEFWAKSQSLHGFFLFLRFLCAFIGDLTLRYLIFKSGRYSPLLYSNVVPG
ncbi:MAG: polysulfide reductase NrfD [Deltaproteobacteria bacterium]|nr:polysulfide reductase NrfD [Deltaproteobacteria bacterium]